MYQIGNDQLDLHQETKIYTALTQIFALSTYVYSAMRQFPYK